jgi:hypothetical protein
VLALCQRAGLVSLGHVALDGTKVLANASEPDTKAQRDFTDPESRIMKDGATKGFVQAHNAQAAVNGAAEIIVAAAVTHEADDLAAIDLYVPPGRQTHGEDASGPVLDDGTVIGAMRAKVQTAAGHVVCALRKTIAEPAFGQIKDARHFRRFSFHGLVKVRAEWLLIRLTHNLLKLFRAGCTPHPA